MRGLRRKRKIWEGEMGEEREATQQRSAQTRERHMVRMTGLRWLRRKRKVWEEGGQVVGRI